MLRKDIKVELTAINNVINDPREVLLLLSLL